ncbi:spondin domain-containing protein [Halorussus amylolyticus]|uniref:spondin domain-containing protein n=1 Tax=Halorussus amylolyticus TaxID=1126242 RepID=UPI001046FA50|nr:spondin domain-containing protein [Halorussus amylolyticus]
MTDRFETTRRTVLAGVAGTALTVAGVAHAQETTTEEGETTTEGSETTTEEGATTAEADEQTTAADGERTTFSVRIVNVSEQDAIQPDEGDPQPVVLSPGAYATHTESGPLFAPDESASEELEALAEDGDPTELGDSLAGASGVSASGVFDTAVEGGDAGPIGPGDAYGFEVAAAPGESLSFATMFVPSNDLFFAPGPSGIPLFRDGEPISGGVTDQVQLWDAGTEENEAPGVGENQAPRQSEPDTGSDEDAAVRPIDAVEDGFSYPSVTDSIRILVVPLGGNVGATD